MNSLREYIFVHALPVKIFFFDIIRLESVVCSDYDTYRYYYFRLAK